MNRDLIDQARSDRGELEQALSVLGVTFRGSEVTCPFHPDKNPSASIYEANGGAWKVHCHVCCSSWDVWDLRAKIQGKGPADVLREALRLTPIQGIIQTATPQNRLETALAGKGDGVAFATLPDCQRSFGQALESTYVYGDPLTGHIDMVVFRLIRNGRKTFLQGHQTERGIILKAPPKPWPLYRRDILLTASRVVVVEGEKCADALIAIGIPATTSPGGAGKAPYADWQPLAGKRVDLWPDNDPPGKDGKRTGLEHMRDVERILGNIRPGVATHWLDPDGLGLPEKGDAADLLEGLDGKDAETCRVTVMGILDEAESLGASIGVGKLIEDTIAGRRVAAPFPWPVMTSLTKALLPGTVTLLGGAGGSTKSFLIMQCLSYWHEHNIRADIYMLEDDRDYHLYRALAQYANNANIFDDEWIRAHPEETRAAFIANRAYLDAIGPCIWDANGNTLTLAQLAEWVRERASGGARVIVIDPITAANAEDKAWAEDLAFIMSVKKSAVEYGASVVLVTHPKKGAGSGRGKPSMDDLAGGAAYQRFSHTVLMLEAQDTKEMTVLTADDDGPPIQLRHVNRLLRVCKSRNARGSGMMLGMFFNGGTLKFIAQGIIQGPQSVDKPATPHSTGKTRHQRLTDPPHDNEMAF